MDNNLQRQRKGRKLIVAFLGIILLFHAVISKTPPVLPVSDFLEYWVAVHLMLSACNPYSPQQMKELEQSLGWEEDHPLLMWNPPWTLSLLSPLGMFTYYKGRYVWFVLNLELLFLCIGFLWKFYNGPTRQWIGYLVGFVFFPGIFTLIIGQISILILLGLVGFLFFEKRGHPWLAGLASGLLSIKPHLLYLFWVVLVLQVWKKKDTGILMGAFVGIIGGSLIVFLYNPETLIGYWDLITHESPLHHATATIGMLLRVMTGVEKRWLQFVPTALGTVWVLHYWKRKHKRWSWPEQMPILVFASVLTAAYGWIYDQVVLLPAVLQMASWAVSNKSFYPKLCFFSSYFLINGITIWIYWHAWNHGWYIWQIPFLLGLYHILGSPIMRKNETLQDTSPLRSDITPDHSV